VQRSLVEELGGTFHHVVGDDIPVALLDFARGVNATQIVLGISRRKCWRRSCSPPRNALAAFTLRPIRLSFHCLPAPGWRAGKNRVR